MAAFAPEAAPSPVSAPPHVDGFAIGRVLGRGGFGTVYEAERVGEGLRVALKVVNAEAPPSARARLEREIAALRAVGPPHVPALHASGVTAEGAPFFAMDRLEARSLDQRLAELRNGMEADEFVATAQGLIAALEAVHARQLVHRDLKPENIFISGPHATLIDFGLVHGAGLSGSAALDKEGIALGTAEYMAPEQTEGRLDLDERADLYALGVIFFEMLTGRTPFFGPANEVHQAHVNLRPPRPTRFAPAAARFEELVLRCLAKDRNQRFASVAALGQALREAAAQAATATGQASAAPAPAAKAATGSASQRRAMAVLFFIAAEGGPRIAAELRSMGADIAEAAGDRYTAVFGQAAGENPARHAVRAARHLVDRGFTRRAVIDLASVQVITRKDNSRRYLSSQFARGPELLAGPTDTPEVLVTPAVREVLPQLGDLEARGDLLQVPPDDLTRTEEQSTQVRLYAEGLLGRDELCRELLASARQAFAERAPTLTTIIGDIGLGKSHLAATLSQALDRRIRILDVRGREDLGGVAHPTLQVLLRALMDLPSGMAVPASELRGRLSRLLGEALGHELWPAVSLLLGAAAVDDPAVAAVRAAPGVLRAGAMRAAGEGLRRAASQQPVALFVDDAHLADDAALDAVEYASATADAPLWACVLGRPALEARRPSWGARAQRSRRVELAPLSPEHARELCRRLLRPADNIPLRALELLAERTKGVPLLTIELINGLKRDGVVRKSGDTQAWILATDELDRLPDLPLVEWFAQSRLQHLPADLTAHAGLVAVLGSDAWLEDVDGTIFELDREGLGQPFELDTRVALRRLVDADVLVRHRQDRFSFRHGLLREALLKSLPAAQRSSLHRAAFRHLRSSSAALYSERLPALAYHAEHAGLREEAAELSFGLAESLKQRHAYLEAERSYRRALELTDAANERRQLEILGGLGLMRYRVGRYRESLEDFGKARELAERTGDRARAVELLLDEATALDWMNEYRTSKERVEQAESLAATDASPLVRARLQMAHGRTHLRFGDWDGACRCFTEAVALAEPLGDAAYETLVVSLVMLGPTLTFAQRVDEAERIFERAVALATTHTDRLHLGSAISNRFVLWMARRDVARAIGDLRQKVEISKELGMLPNECRSEHNLAELLYQAGEVDEALLHIDRAIELWSRGMGRSTPPTEMLLKARLLLFAGQQEAARTVWRELRALEEEARSRGNAKEGLMPPDQALASMVDLATREASDAEWDALVAQAKQLAVQSDPIEVVEMRGLTALRRGDRAQARQWLEEARAMAATTPTLMERRLDRELASAAEG